MAIARRDHEGAVGEAAERSVRAFGVASGDVGRGPGPRERHRREREVLLALEEQADRGSLGRCAGSADRDKPIERNTDRPTPYEPGESPTAHPRRDFAKDDCRVDERNRREPAG